MFVLLSKRCERDLAASPRGTEQITWCLTVAPVEKKNGMEHQCKKREMVTEEETVRQMTSTCADYDITFTFYVKHRPKNGKSDIWSWDSPGMSVRGAWLCRLMLFPFTLWGSPYPPWCPTTADKTFRVWAGSEPPNLRFKVRHVIPVLSRRIYMKLLCATKNTLQRFIRLWKHSNANMARTIFFCFIFCI